MIFNRHPSVEGLHAVLSASKPHWTNYDAVKMNKVLLNKQRAAQGARKHEWAAEAIRLRMRQENNGKTLNSYINDGIGFRMSVEVVLFYSVFFFGTADAISFDAKNGVLRIHDLKTGEHPADERQLFVYCALFCLEYEINPYDIRMILRIYQNDEILEFEGDPKEIRRIMDLGRRFSKMTEEVWEL